MTITLYRGITVRAGDVHAVTQRILKQGLMIAPESAWCFECNCLKSRLEELLEKPDLTTDDTRPTRWVKTSKGEYSELIGGFPAICACADILGASYYALKHNQNINEGISHGLIISFQAEIADLQVDGRDFLYNSVFRDARVSDQRAKALELFGPSLGRYLDRAMVSNDISYKFAMCDLAVQDDEVINAHAMNNTVIGGRHGTVFRSAFFVKAPVIPSKILFIEDARHRDLLPQVTIESFRRMAEKDD